MKARLWLRRIGWLVAIWAGSVAALGLAAGLMRLLMRLAGLHTGI
ncbi:DUF2474 domain-containing protein [Massilia sp. R2A-15]|nr:DUF2474 domain-containing protein [Massilia sp. R2A-15]WLI91595.1 DUF2474 domain-containing protein [Massilia sp. R2A-15]